MPTTFGVLVTPPYTVDELLRMSYADMQQDEVFQQFRDDYLSYLDTHQSVEKDLLIQPLTEGFEVIDTDMVDRAYIRLLRSSKHPVDLIVQVHYVRSLILFAIFNGTTIQESYLKCVDRLLDDCLTRILRAYHLGNLTDVESSVAQPR